MAVFKVSQFGQWRWGSRLGGFDMDFVQALSTDLAGYAYLSGTANGADTLGGVGFTGAGSHYVARLDKADGQVLYVLCGGTVDLSEAGGFYAMSYSAAR